MLYNGLANKVGQVINSKITTGAQACIIKRITAVIYGFRNKLVFVDKH